MAKKFRNLRERMTPGQRARARARADELARAMPLQELRAARKLSQKAIAATLRTGQSSVSRLERRADMYLSTLRSYIEAMGGQLEITARFPDGTVTISLLGEIGDPSAALLGRR